jgi:hypothetical protein
MELRSALSRLGAGLLARWLAMTVSNLHISLAGFSVRL